MKTHKENPNQQLIDMLNGLKKTINILPDAVKNSMDTMYEAFGDADKEAFAQEMKKQNVESILQEMRNKIKDLNNK